MTPAGPKMRAIAIALVVACFAAAACSRHDDAREPAAAAASDDETSDTEENGGDPCSLLTVAEVEKAIGPLAGPPYRADSNGASPDGDRCRYDTRDLHSLSVAVTWSGGASIMKMLGMPAAVAEQAQLRGRLPLPDGVTLTGEWDEAKFLPCCTFQTLRGDSYVGFDYAGTTLSDEAAVALLNSALQRLDSPLREIDGSAGIAAARERDRSNAGRPPPRPACELLTAEDVAALVGPVEKVPGSRDTECAYRGTGKPQLVELKVEWRDGYRTLRERRSAARSAMQALVGEAAHGAGTPPEHGNAGPWEAAELQGTSFVAVRRDVLMTIDLRATTETVAREAVARAMQRVSWP